MSGGILGFSKWASGLGVLLASRGESQGCCYSTIDRMVSIPLKQKNYPYQNANSAEIKKPIIDGLHFSLYNICQLVIRFVVLATRALTKLCACH